MHGNVLKAAPRTANRSSNGTAKDTAAGPVAPPSDHPSDLPPAPPPVPPSDIQPDPSPGVQVLRLAARAATLRRATGSDDARVHDWLVNDLSFALNMSPVLDAPARANRVWAAVSAMCDIGPGDTLEGMLAAQMVAVHSAALDCLRRSAEPISADRARDADLR